MQIAHALAKITLPSGDACIWNGSFCSQTTLVFPT